MSKVWLITGSSRGLGYEFASAALARGDRVAATAREPAALDQLVERFGDAVLPLALDVTDRDAAAASVAEARERFGALDVVVNNAGYGLFGAVEEVSEAEVRAQFETNVFGALWVTQAALPVMRGQGGGHIVQVSSVGGVVAIPYVGIYNASKWALEAFSDALAKEVTPHGVKVTIVEPGAYATEWGGASKEVAETELPAYDHLREARAEAAADVLAGDPAASGRALLEIVDSADPPLRVFFGAGAYEWVSRTYEKRLATWRQWGDLAETAHGRGAR